MAAKKKAFGLTIDEFFESALVEAIRRQETLFESSETLTSDENFDKLKAAAMESEFYQSSIAHKPAIEEIFAAQKQAIYLLPPYRQPVVVRSPSADEVSSYQLELMTIEEEREDKVDARERAKRRLSVDHLFTSKLIVYPKKQLLPNQLQMVHGFVGMLLQERMEAESLKLVG